MCAAILTFGINNSAAMAWECPVHVPLKAEAMAHMLSLMEVFTRYMVCVCLEFIIQCAYALLISSPHLALGGISMDLWYF